MSGQPGRSASARTTLSLIGIAMLAVVLRIGAIVYTHATHAPAEENRIIARNLAAGRGFTFTEFTVTGPTAIRGPVYPMLLAVVGPNRMKLILAINVLIGAATVLAAYALARRLLFPLPVLRGRAREGVFSAASAIQADPLPNPLPEYRERGPDCVPTDAVAKSSFALLLAAGLFAIWPTQIYAATLTQGLSLAVFLTLASLALAFRRTPGSLITAGLLAGLAALTEPVLALPLLLCAIVLGWRDRQRLWHWQDAVVFVFTAVVLIAPWLYRNAIVFGRPMPITSNFWRDVYLGSGPPPASDFHNPKFAATRNQATAFTSRISTLSPREFDQLKVPEPERTLVFHRWAWNTITENPKLYAGQCGYRLIQIVIGNYDHRLGGGVAGLIFAVLFVSNLVFSRTQSIARWLGISLITGLVVPTTLTFASPRLVVLLDLIIVFALSHPRAKRPNPSVQDKPSCADKAPTGTQ